MHCHRQHQEKLASQKQQNRMIEDPPSFGGTKKGVAATRVLVLKDPGLRTSPARAKDHRVIQHKKTFKPTTL
jgi:hypothetical protein